MDHRPMGPMAGSWLNRTKEMLISTLPFPGETLLALLGLGCYLGTCTILRRPLSWAGALVPGLCLSLAIEAWEIHAHWSASGVSIRGHVLVMNLPAAVVCATALWLDRTHVRRPARQNAEFPEKITRRAWFDAAVCPAEFR